MPTTPRPAPLCISAIRSPSFELFKSAQTRGLHQDCNFPFFPLGSASFRDDGRDRCIERGHCARRDWEPGTDCFWFRVRRGCKAASAAHAIAHKPWKLLVNRDARGEQRSSFTFSCINQRKRHDCAVASAVVCPSAPRVPPLITRPRRMLTAHLILGTHIPIPRGPSETWGGAKAD